MDFQESIVPAPDLVDRLLPSIRPIMQIQDLTSGSADQEFVARFRGQLMIDSMQAYDRLKPVFDGEGVTLHMRKEEGLHVVLAIPGVIRPKPSNPVINLILFVLTLLSVLYAGEVYVLDKEALLAAGGNLLLAMQQMLPQAMSFAVSMLAILLAHEFGHYLAARRHKTAVSLPYFIPFPGNLFGTMGAFINLKEPPRNRKVLLDIGLAGPLAGLAVAIPILLYGLSISEVTRLPTRPIEGMTLTLEGNSILYLLAKYLVTGEWLPAPISYGGIPPILYWARFILLGRPIPLGGRDILLHPVAWAGWAGLLVTGLNLIPVGQLDGGHAIYVLLGKKTRLIWPFAIVILIALGFVWAGWWLWAGLLFLLGRTYAEPLDLITPLDNWRKLLALFGLIVFILVFMPVPLQTIF
jgi:membrane-associated protease RseP (regulator of RpoE activity)